MRLKFRTVRMSLPFFTVEIHFLFAEFVEMIKNYFNCHMLNEYYWLQ